MLQWFKKNYRGIITAIITICLGVYLISCEPKTESITDPQHKVTRAELQIELDKLMATAEVRMADLQKQEQFRQLLLENAVAIAQGQPYNPVGILTGIAAIYGAVNAGTRVTKVVKNGIKKKDTTDV